jgi:hypothetical protein
MFWFMGKAMQDDIKEIVRRLRAMATRADAISRALDQHRRSGTMSAPDAGALHRLATSAREFNQRAELSFAALPDRFK